MADTAFELLPHEQELIAVAMVLGTARALELASPQLGPEDRKRVLEALEATITSSANGLADIRVARAFLTLRYIGRLSAANAARKAQARKTMTLIVVTLASTIALALVL